MFNFKISTLFFCFINFVFVDVTVTENETSNDTFVMKINPSNDNFHLQPRILISNYNQDRKGRKITPENESQEFTEPERYTGEISFPRNLEIIPNILPKLSNQNCVRDTKLALEAISRHERWTLEMFDSFPKFPVGILTGNHYQLGNFDECVEARQPIKDLSAERIRGQYCLVDIFFGSSNDGSGRNPDLLKKSTNRFAFNKTILHWGICLPSSCNPNDTKIFVQEIFKTFMEKVEIVEVNIQENMCHVEKTIPLNKLEIIYGSIIGLFIMFIIFATAFHCWTLRKRQNFIAYNVESVREQSTVLNEVILCFSVIRTVKKFLHTKPSDLNLECICGIKFITMLVIINGHTLLFIVGGPIENAKFVSEQSVQWQNTLYFNSALLVDTFLIISGFLMCRLLLLELEKRKGQINILILYIARYIRLTPSYLVVIGLYCTFLHRLGSGPLWDYRTGLEADRCLNSWWTNLLYVNNYVNTDKLCMFQSWYLAVDYHLFIVAPFIIIPLWKWQKIGKTLLGICIVVSICVPFWITYKDKLDPTMLAFPPEVSDLTRNTYFSQAYIKTHMRTSSYFIGILFGYIVHRMQKAGTKIPTYVVCIGSVIATISAILSLFSVVVFYIPDREQNVLENAIYAPLHRVGWCLGIGWILVLCITDNAEMINKLLSWKPFIPLSRLTYCAYLINGFVEIYHVGVLRQNSYMNIYELSSTLLSHSGITLAFAFILCILFESPIHGLEKILLSKHKVKEQRQKSTLRPMEES